MLMNNLIKKLKKLVKLYLIKKSNINNKGFIDKKKTITIINNIMGFFHGK